MLPPGCVAADRPRHVIAAGPELLATPLPHGDEVAWRACERQCAALLAERRARTGTAGRVRARLSADPEAMPSMEQVARELHVDARTLRRRLAAEGVAFRGLVDEVRAALADELLTTTDLSVDEIAGRLGFAEATSFTRAFKRWRGEPPAGYRGRRAALSAAPGPRTGSGTG
jgi:AraC-like DNA-binding protein